MNLKSSGTYVRTSNDGGAPHDKGETQVFPAPPRASENGARRPFAGTPGVSMLATVEVGSAESDPSKPGLTAAAPPRRAARMNEPTQILIISPEPLVLPDAKASGIASTQTETFAAPPFSPVPVFIGSRAPQTASSIASRPPQTASSIASRPPQVTKLHGFEQPVATHGASQPAKALAAPLLRAFDDGRPRATTWSTAKTVLGPLSQLVEGDGGTSSDTSDSASSAGLERAEPKPSSASPLHLVARLRRASKTTKFSALVAAMALVVSLGSFVGRNVAKSLAPGKAPSQAAAIVKAAAPDDAPATDTAAAPEDVAPPPPGPAAGEPSTPPPAALGVAEAKVFHAKPSTARGGNGSRGVTLARQAVDALLAGDRPTALRHYEELSRQAPDRGAYREAVRLLTASASDTP